MSGSQKWLNVFNKAIRHLRIQSKHAEKDPDGAGIKLKLWTSQRMVLEKICEGLDNDIHIFVVLKSRQLGVTTITLAVILFWLALHPNTIGIYVADNEGNAEKARTTIKKYVESWHEFMGKSFSIVKNNKHVMGFSNGSRLDVRVAGKTKTTWGEGEGYLVGHLCVAKGTPVVVEHGRIKPIEDVRIGDRVLTHTGAAATVVDVMGQANSKPMLRITPWLGQAFTCSLDHTIPTQRGTIHASELLLSDRLIMPQRRITHEIESMQLPESRTVSGRRYADAGGRFVSADTEGAVLRDIAPWFTVKSVGGGMSFPINEETGFAIGYYLAEGSLLHTTKGNHPCGVTFTRHRDEASFCDRAIAALAPFTTGNRRVHDVRNSLTTTEAINGSPLAQFIGDNFGCLDNKHIPDWTFTAGEDFCRGMLCGLLSGDGSKSVSKTQPYPANTMVMPTTRSSIAMQARDLAAALGYGWGAIRYEPGGNKYGRFCKPIWRLMWAGAAASGLRDLVGLPRVPGGQAFTQKYEIRDGLIYLKIRKIERDINEPEMWDISVDHEDHTFRTPYCAIGNTEVSKYGQAAGIDAFRHAMAPNNPRALYVFESTAYGVNHFQSLWEEAESDPSTMMPIFVGWWSNETNILRDFSASYQTFGSTGPTPGEQDLIKIVRDRYNYEITMPQLAWKRWQEAHSTSGAIDTDQNQPWYAEQAFVESGFSFYQVRRVTDRMQEISDTERGLPVEEGGYAYLPYRFLLGLDYHLSQVEFLDANLVTGEDVTLRIWEKPQDGAMYAIGFDPAFGRNDYGNNHSVSVWRCFADKLVQVAEYAENDVTTVQAAWVLAWLAGRYFPCMVNIDLTGGLGLVVMQEFSNLRSRMQSDWYRDRIGDGFDDFLAGASWYLYHRMDSPGPGFMYGSKMSHDLKFKMMNQHRDAWVSDLLEIRSVPMLREMLNIRQTGPDIGAAAQGREKDDRTFASALACMTWVEHIRPGQIANGITWKSETMREQGTATAASIKINRMVQSVLVSANEEPDYRPPRTFLGDRGLV